MTSIWTERAQELARPALHAYMLQYSESYAAGWLYGMHEDLTGRDETYDWLVSCSGGHYNDDEEFVPHEDP